VELLLPIGAFAGFLLVFAVQARREGKSVGAWAADREAAAVYRPGWWKPLAVLVAAMIVLFVGFLTVDQGFRWRYLLVIPILGGFFAVSVATMSWAFQRRSRDR
jgi:peptidoglycan/LPS O-acetylase OafA/YrhL